MWFTNMDDALSTRKDDMFPPGAANNWWITARSPFARMRAVFSEPKPRVKQNPALLRYAVTLQQDAQFWTRRYMRPE
jgi:hypothetical protein